jgi:diguanylate cyclase (GGDEF)-like protein
MHLDTPTLIFAGFVISVGASIGFTFLLAVLHEQLVLRQWAASLWVATFGVVLIGLRNQIPDALSIVVGNGAIAVGNMLVLRGIAMHVRGPWNWRIPTALIAVYVALMSWYTFGTPNLAMRFIFASLLGLIWAVWGVALLLRHGQREIRISCRVTATILALQALFYATRLLVPISASAGQDVMKADSPVAFTYIVGILIGLAMYFALLMLITERLMVDLRQVARTDGLTGLLNRGAIISQGASSLRQCQQRGQPFAVLLFDLDRFKHINDTWGHEAGDAVLQHFTGIVHESAHWPACLASRYGGEEFLLALPNATLPEAMAMAEVLRHTLARSPARFGDFTIPVTTSIGVAMAAGDIDFEPLIAQADEALYRAKSDGRDRVVHAAAEDDQAPLKAEMR